MSKQKHRGHNEGSIFQRKDGRWVAELPVGLDGQGKKLVLRWYGQTRKEVAAQLTTALNDRQQGLMPKPSKQTTGQFLDAWMKDVLAPSVRHTTLELYTRILRHIEPLRNVPLQKLTPQEVQRLCRELRDQGYGRTVEVFHAVLHKAFGQAVKWGLVPRNIMDAVEVLKTPTKEFRPLTQEEANRLLKTASQDRLRALYVLALGCGLRFGELPRAPVGRH